MADEDREARLKRQLRANLHRRKARARAAGEPQDEPATQEDEKRD